MDLRKAQRKQAKIKLALEVCNFKKTFKKSYLSFTQRTDTPAGLLYGNKSK